MIRKKSRAEIPCRSDALAWVTEFDVGLESFAENRL